MGHFFFVRHGETVWNVENKICGMTDIGLTEKGFEQARITAEKIRDEHLDATMILSSPLSRARDTAAAIANATGLPMRTDERLREQCFGIYEATPRDGEEFYQAKMHFIDRYGNGESMFQTAHRVYSLLDEITAQDDQVYILVAHNGLARIVQSYFVSMENDEFAGFGLKNCEIRRYDY